MKKVLIVNDEEFLRNVLSTLLTELGFACFTASSSEDGEKLFFENPDLEAVLMDALGPEGVLYTLPLLKKIVDSGFKGVLVTMSSNPDYRKEMVNAGCTDEWDSVTGIPVLVRILNRESVMVLVVDDDEPFQFLVKRWLEEIPQVHVHQAFTTDEALALFETSLSESEKPYNIIMMDADLPARFRCMSSCGRCVQKASRETLWHLRLAKGRLVFSAARVVMWFSIQMRRAGFSRDSLGKFNKVNLL